jgi:preprotein translocase subunit SecA
MPVENRLIAKSIEKAQQRVEGSNFDIRKHLLEYDDVVNKHRETIYRKRREILRSQDVDSNYSRQEIIKMIQQEIDQIINLHLVNDHKSQHQLDEIYKVIATIFPLKNAEQINLTQIINQIADKVDSIQKIKIYLYQLAEKAYERLEQKVNDSKLMRRLEAGILLRSIDTLWIEHLEAIDYLKTGIGLRGYGQREPLVEFKKESFKLFNHLLDSIQNQVVYSIYKIGLADEIAPGVLDQASQSIQLEAPDKQGNNQFQSTTQTSDRSQNIKKDIKHKYGRKIGRNDECPCGSGKKYKKCCMAKDGAEGYIV